MTKKAEIEYLDKIGEEGVIHAVNKPYSDSNRGGLFMELGAVMTLMPPPPARVLECGCGTGGTSCILARCGYDVTGIDIAPRMIHYSEQNRLRGGLDNARFVEGDFEEAGFSSEFDCVLFFGSLHHAESEASAVKAAYNALKPGGFFVASEPGLGHHLRRVAKDAMEKYGVTEKDMTPKKMWKAGREAGFTDFRVYPRSQVLSVITYPNESYDTEGRMVDFMRRNILAGPLRTLAAIFLFVVFKRFDGIVVMRKPGTGII